MARPKSSDPVVFQRVGLRQPNWDYLMSWKEGDDSPTRNLEELVEWAQKMRPSGASGFGREVKQPRYRAPLSVAKFAEKNQLTRTEALAVIAQRYRKEHPEEFE